MHNFVLFDIDGTLVLTGGAGVRAMARAIETVTGHRDALEHIPIAGRTDWSILHDATAGAGLELDATLFARLRDQYIAYLRDEVLRHGTGRKGVMPGIRGLLDRLQAHPDVWLGLLTGNFIEGARLKLEYFDLWKYFRCGAYGGDAADRNALVPVALDRARKEGMPDVAPDRVFVVGDTPHDVACARAVGAVPIAVATGSYSVDELRQSGADIVFADLSDAGAFCAILGAR